LSVLAGAGAVYFKIQLSSGQLFERWMSRRYDAEHRRSGYFKTVYETDDPERRDPQTELDLPSLRFEYFRRYQLDVQLIYFDRRGEQHDKAARKLIGWEAFLAAGAALVAGLLAHPKMLGDTAAILALIGVLIPTLVSARSSLSMLSQDQRHAARYKTNKETLLEKSKEIDGIRKELEAGEEGKARNFADEVNAILAQELDVWKSAFV
jgi:hypothetical protein